MYRKNFYKLNLFISNFFNKVPIYEDSTLYKRIKLFKKVNFTQKSCNMYNILYFRSLKRLLHT